jgi:hypothetical protein
VKKEERKNKIKDGGREIEGKKQIYGERGRQREEGRKG